MAVAIERCRDRDRSSAAAGLRLFQVANAGPGLLQRPDDAELPLLQVDVAPFEPDQLAPAATEIYGCVDQGPVVRVDRVGKAFDLGGRQETLLGLRCRAAAVTVHYSSHGGIQPRVAGSSAWSCLRTTGASTRSALQAALRSSVRRALFSSFWTSHPR